MENHLRYSLALLSSLALSGLPNAAFAAAPPPLAPQPHAVKSVAVYAPASHAPVPLSASDLNAFMDGLFPYAIQRAGIPGGGIVVVRNGSVLFTKGYGFSDVATRAPVIPDRTLFRPGSVSKLFTWTAVMQQVEAGRIDLDADVNQYLDFKIPPAFGKPVTMRDLMTHTPGFDETIRDLIFDKADQVYPLDQYLKKRMPARIFPPGQVIAYSNYGATLAGYIVQRVSGEPFDEYLTRHIFTPLRMMHSTFVQPLPPALQPLMSKGYAEGAGQPPTPFEYIEAAPAGALSSTVSDMSRFMLAYLNGGQYEGGRILKPATIREMWTLQVAPVPGIIGFGLGFYQENRNGLTIVGHGGDTNAFHSDLHLIPKQNVGFFVAFNSPGAAGAVEKVRTEIFNAFLNRYYPYTPPAEKTVANPQRDAARVAGWYQSSRRDARALTLVYALGQSSVNALPNGEIEVAGLTSLADTPLKWREVGPLYYRQTDGQAHLRFATDAHGNVVAWASDLSNMVSVMQRVNGLTALGTLKMMLVLFIAILLISLLIRLGAWIARRKLHLRLALTPQERWVHLLARIGALAFLLTLVGWVALLSNDKILLSSSLAPMMVILYIAGLIAVVGGIGMIAETILRVRGGPGGWLVRSGEILVGLAAIYGIWLFATFGLINFVTNF